MEARLSKMVIDQTERENRCDTSLALIPPGPDVDPVVGANELSEVMKTANPLRERHRHRIYTGALYRKRPKHQKDLK